MCIPVQSPRTSISVQASIQEHRFHYQSVGRHLQAYFLRSDAHAASTEDPVIWLLVLEDALPSVGQYFFPCSLVPHRGRSNDFGGSVFVRAPAAASSPSLGAARGTVFRIQEGVISRPPLPPVVTHRVSPAHRPAPPRRPLPSASLRMLHYYRSRFCLDLGDVCPHPGP